MVDYDESASGRPAHGRVVAEKTTTKIIADVRWRSASNLYSRRAKNRQLGHGRPIYVTVAGCDRVLFPRKVNFEK